MGLLASMGNSHRFHRASRRPWANALHGCEFCTASLPREHPPGDRWLAWDLAMGTCWDASPGGWGDASGNGHEAAVGPDSSSACGLDVLIRTF